MTLSTTTIKTATGAIGIAAAGLLTAATASANPDVMPFGHTAQLSNAGGAEVTGYTVGNLQPSGHNDGVWFSDVTARANKSSVTPIIGDFNARAADGATYTSMQGTQPYGLSNQPIAPGGQSHGRIYFDVGLGPAPDSVVYTTGGGSDRLIWKG